MIQASLIFSPVLLMPAFIRSPSERSSSGSTAMSFCTRAIPSTFASFSASAFCAAVATSPDSVATPPSTFTFTSYFRTVSLVSRRKAMRSFSVSSRSCAVAAAGACGAAPDRAGGPARMPARASAVGMCCVMVMCLQGVRRW